MPTLTATPLDVLAPTLVAEAHEAGTGRASLTLVGGTGHALRQTVIALCADEELAEHSSPGEATLLVLLGSVELVVGAETRPAARGELLVIPPAPHSLRAVEDAAVLLTVVKR